MKYFVAYICIYSDIFSHKMWIEREREKGEEWMEEDIASCEQAHLSLATYPKTISDTRGRNAPSILFYCFVNMNLARPSNIMIF